MIATETIREVMKRKEVKPSLLASRLRIKNNVLSERLSQRNISVNKMDEMLRVLGYKIMVVPEGFPVPEACFEISSSQEGEP